MNNKTNDKELLVSYIGADLVYQQDKLMYIAGLEDAAEGDVGTLTLPEKAQGVDIDPRQSDVVVFSYTYQGSLRELTARINSFATPTVPAVFDVLVPAVGGAWVTQAANITLQLPDNSSVVNPHGLAENGDYLYLIDNASRSISIVGKAALEAATDNAPLPVQALDLSGALEIDAKGQAIIALNGTIYALYVVSNAAATEFHFSQLLRLTIGAGGALTLDVQTLAGLNAQSIIPVNDGADIQLLIPAVGGRQFFDGGTNGTTSNISVVPALGTWPTTAPVKLTGDPVATPATAYDIHAVAAAMRDGDSILYLLTQIYTGGSATASPDAAPWRLYWATVTDFLSISAPNNTISAAVTAGKLTLVDEDIARATDEDIAYGIYFWDILYEQVPGNDSTADRLWFTRGTPLLATRTGEDLYGDPAYGSPTAVLQGNPYVLYGFLGGVNVNSIDLTIETLNQAARNVSLKRSLRGSLAARPSDEEIAAAQAKAAGKAK
jgi:hypothetical protein